MRRLALPTVIVLVLVLCLVSLGLKTRKQCELAVPSGKCYTVDWARTASQKEQGLSGRTGLADNQAMVFVFDPPSKACFWMKDMQFSIDIVWTDSSGKVVYIKENATPASYPDTFCPDAAATNVIELNAGQAMANGVVLGSVIKM